MPPHLFSWEHKSIVTTLISELDTEGDGSDPLVILGSIIAIKPVARVQASKYHRVSVDGGGGVFMLWLCSIYSTQYPLF